MRKDMTPSEVTLWKRLRRSGLGARFRRQQPIGPYIADFACMKHRIIVEADGNHHDWSEYDESRSRYLEHDGYQVLRFANRDIADHPDWVVEEIKKAVRKRR
jgi:very-short-patch-repair endonuclease